MPLCMQTFFEGLLFLQYHDFLLVLLLLVGGGGSPSPAGCNKRNLTIFLGPVTRN